MNNIIVGVKKFFKNKNTVTILALIVSLGLLYYVYTWRINKATQPVVVPYAINAIGPRTYITEDLLSTKKVPGGVVTGEVMLNRTEIIGKYVNKDAVVPQNGLFYKSAVVTWEEISDTIYSDILEGHTIFTLEVNKNTTYGNSIYPGNYIDLYFETRESATNNSKDRLVIGKFIESIRVLGVTDSSGNNVFETNGNPASPKYLVFSVNDEYYELLKKAIYVFGKDSIYPVPRNASYSENPKETSIANSYLHDYILNRSYTPVSVDNNNGGVN